MPACIRSMHGAPDSCHWIGFRLVACQRYRGLRSSTRLLEAFCNPRKLTLFYNHRALCVQCLPPMRTMRRPRSQYLLLHPGIVGGAAEPSVICRPRD